MQKQLVQLYAEGDITDDVLEEAVRLYSNHYGVWSKLMQNPLNGSRIGRPVRLNKTRIRAECLPHGVPGAYVRILCDHGLIGHAFACRWKCAGREICWITQLVVHRDYRRRAIATRLLTELKQSTDDVYGIASSHPAACMAAARAFGGGIENLDLGFIQQHCETIMKVSPIRYVREAELAGRLFKPGTTDETISIANTKFLVDQTEPLEALTRLKGVARWPLGELLEGHEFVVVFDTARNSYAVRIDYSGEKIRPRDFPQHRKREPAAFRIVSDDCIELSTKHSRIWKLPISSAFALLPTSCGREEHLDGRMWADRITHFRYIRGQLVPLAGTARGRYAALKIEAAVNLGAVDEGC